MQNTIYLILVGLFSLGINSYKLITPEKPVKNSATLVFNFTGTDKNFETIQVTALRFDNKIATEFLEAPKSKAYTINVKGILRPTENYQVLLHKKDKVLVLLSRKEEYTSYLKIDGYDEIDLPGDVTMACYCTGNGYDDCFFRLDDDSGGFECNGNCDCDIGIIFNGNKPPLQYETAGGRWYNF